MRIGAGLGVKQEGRGAPVDELVACRSGTFEAWVSLEDGRSKLLELTLSRLAIEGGLTKLLAVALRRVKRRYNIQNNKLQATGNLFLVLFFFLAAYSAKGLL